jgi:hypothetical protein
MLAARLPSWNQRSQGSHVHTAAQLQAHLNVILQQQQALLRHVWTPTPHTINQLSFWANLQSRW